MDAAKMIQTLNEHFQKLYLQFPGEQFNCIVTAVENARKQNYPFLVTGYAISAKPYNRGPVQVQLWSEIAKVKPAPIMTGTVLYTRTSRNVLISHATCMEDGTLSPIPIPLLPPTVTPVPI